MDCHYEGMLLMLMGATAETRLKAVNGIDFPLPAAAQDDNYNKFGKQ